MTFASRMQHKIYWGPMKKPIEWSLKTVLAPWAYIASVIYHDSFWYPLNAKRLMRDVLDEPLGAAVPQLGDRRRRTPTAIPTSATDVRGDREDRRPRAAGVHRHPRHVHQGSAGVCQPAAPRRRQEAKTSTRVALAFRPARGAKPA